MGIDIFNVTDTSSADDILFVLHVGTGISFLGAFIIISTFAAATSLHQKRALKHIIVKSSAIVIMAIGYWLDIFLKGSSCEEQNFCAIQFVLLQLGNCGILVSEFAMALEIYLLAKHFNNNTLDELISKGTPFYIKAVYAFFSMLALVSIVTGLVQYLDDNDQGLYCYLGSWCWYLDPWAVFVFKFGWMILVISFGISTIGYLFYSMHLVTRDKTAVKMTSKVAVMLRNLVICHIFAWGLAFVWRVARSVNDPPLWSIDPKSIVVIIVVFNAAGAGYLDVLIWLSFPDIRKEYSLDKIKQKIRSCCGFIHGNNEASVIEGQEDDLEFSQTYPNSEWK